MIWIRKHPQATFGMLGLIPTFFSDEDPRPAKEQADAHYGHGGGWRPFKGFTMLPNGDLQYPEDPPMQLLAEAVLHSNSTNPLDTSTNPEWIRFYECSWVAIVQTDGSYEICRMD